MPLIPPGGIKAGPISVGPLVRILGQADVDAVSAEVTLVVGARLDIPAESVVRLNFDDSTDNKIGGWVPFFTPVGPELSGSVNVSASIGPRFQLEVGMSFLGRGTGVGIALTAPTLGVTLGADGNTAGGVCDNPDAKLGVNIDVRLSAQLDAFGGVGDLRELPHKFELVSTSTPLFATCLAIGESAPSEAPATPADAPAATTTVDSGTTPTDSATATGSVTNFTFSDSEDCSSESSEGTLFVESECIQFVFNGEFTSTSLNFSPFEAEGSNCILSFFGDEACATIVGPAFQPSNGHCIGTSALGDGGDTVKFLKVQCF